jgi:hypothetical protein
MRRLYARADRSQVARQICVLTTEQLFRGVPGHREQKIPRCYDRASDDAKLAAARGCVTTPTGRSRRQQSGAEQLLAVMY